MPTRKEPSRDAYLRGQNSNDLATELLASKFLITFCDSNFYRFHDSTEYPFIRLQNGNRIAKLQNRNSITSG